MLLGLLSMLCLGSVPACGDGQGRAANPGPAEPDADPPTARHDILDNLRKGRDLSTGPADGGGRAWVESFGALDDQGVLQPGTAPQAGTPGRWVFVYEAGPLGVAAGGFVLLQISPFWNWSQPWVADGGAVSPGWLAVDPGYSTVEGPADTRVEVAEAEMGVLARLVGQPLAPGAQLRFVYGAGGAGARADRFAERSTPFWFSVDGDGDDTSRLLDEPVRLDVLAGPPERLMATLSSCVRPGEVGRLTLAVLDVFGNAGTSFEGSLQLGLVPAGLGLPTEVVLQAADRGCRTLEFRPAEPGVFRLQVTGPGGLLAWTNPLVVAERVEAIRWGDLHGHSHVSDGTGLPEDYFRYARDVAGLDVISLTDHDHWGFRKLDADPQTWAAIRDQVRAFHEPGRFVTLLGYEWTNWIHGHRHVLDFGADEALEVLSAVDERFETPRQLWDALAGRPVLTVAHHSAGEPIPVNWSYVPDPLQEPVTEIISVHGSSEAADCPLIVRGARSGNFVRDVLDRGVRFGFIGSGDSHDGHPGMPHLMNPTGGLAALLTDDLSREGVLAALRARRVYATSGARIVLRCSLDGARLGSSLPADGAAGRLLLVVQGTAPLASIDLVRSGAVVERLDLGGEPVFDLLHEWQLEQLEPGEYVYVRVIQADGHMAWTSPFFLD